ncbi:DUF1932 domain-containing protein [Rhodobacterales bacterium HKCCE3408]|nr:DUF1932 domain-containing protein [Rhodobacterales bacterium HKCCE3408]
MDHVAFLGFGEAGGAILSGWAEARPALVTAFDIKTEDDATRGQMRARYQAHGIAERDGRTALDGAQAVFSLVTADQARVAAEAAAPHLAPGTLFLDGNSCAPDEKRASAAAVEAAGARYVDMAIMAPVGKLKHRVPLLISGPHAADGAAALAAFGMSAEIVGDSVGQAASVKMLRSVVVKGMEALMAESMLAARRAGVADLVLASLSGSDPDIDWESRAARSLERMMVHGTRRAAEMRDVAATVAALGLPPLMATATALWQDRIADTGTEPGPEDLADRADRLNERL